MHMHMCMHYDGGTCVTVIARVQSCNPTLTWSMPAQMPEVRSGAPARPGG